MLLAITFPKLNQDSFQRIQNYRKVHDTLYYHIVDPHFTLVFPVSGWSGEDFIAEIKAGLSGFNSFDFTLKSAVVNKDSFSEMYHTFLVPDNGFSSIVKLHDRLYDGKLLSERRFDIDFIPHIGIGNSPDKFKCKSMADEWNATGFEINGLIDSISIIDYSNATVSTLETVRLGI